MRMSAIDELHCLELRKQKLLDKAKREAFEEVDRVLAVLKTFGLHYELVDQKCLSRRNNNQQL